MSKTKPTPPITKMDHRKDAMHTGHMPAAYSKTHDGKIVSISGNKLVTSSSDGKEHSYTIATDAKLTCDGTVCKIEDLQPGNKTRLTTKPNDTHTAMKVESLKLDAEFAKV